jgi:hypothetical protein
MIHSSEKVQICCYEKCYDGLDAVLCRALYQVFCGAMWGIIPGVMRGVMRGVMLEFMQFYAGRNARIYAVLCGASRYTSCYAGLCGALCEVLCWTLCGA